MNPTRDRVPGARVSSYGLDLRQPQIVLFRHRPAIFPSESAMHVLSKLRSVVHASAGLALVLSAVFYGQAAWAQTPWTQSDPSQEPIPSLADAMDPEARSFVVEMDFQGQNEVSLTSVQVIDSDAPARIGGTGIYRVEILNGEGNRIEAFDWGDPQKVHAYDANGEHVVTTLPTASGRLIFPFSPRAVELQLVDQNLGMPVLFVDLETPARNYCQARPWEPRCREINPPSEEPNLLVTVFGPAQAQPGEPFGVEVRVTNLGASEAMGTMQDPNGYMVDLVLSTDDQLPTEFAVFESHFVEDVLLEGGRLSTTETVPGGESRLYETEVRLPDGTDDGTYCLGAVVDPGQTVHESVELDNSFCFQITVDPEAEA